MEEAVVLFFHHRTDEVTRRHLHLLRTHNDFPVVPLFCDDEMGGTALDDAVRLPMTFQRGRNWHNVDWICRDWFRSSHRIEALRYIWLEWDCLVNAPLRDWYSDLWEADFVASRAVRPPAPWYWFRAQMAFLPHSLVPFATGIAPLNGVVLSRRAMFNYAQTDLPEGIFCELRLPTVLASCGITVSELPPDKASQNRFLPNKASLPVQGQGLFHPVKTQVDASG